MAKYDPPKIKEVIQIIDYAKGKLNNAKLYLGCMRPRSKLFREYNNHLELEAINAGVAGLVLPSKGTISFLKKNGFQLRTFNTCCAV
jgi:uncharacterized radical SAM superfamily protein